MCLLLYHMASFKKKRKSNLNNLWKFAKGLESLSKMAQKRRLLQIQSSINPAESLYHAALNSI